ncbi:MAG: hypothetical protein IJ481_02170 [Alphaproteobacteria bacterium]|nr:hypothetical protein [Alphaproteobacteria bacterium]
MKKNIILLFTAIALNEDLVASVVQPTEKIENKTTEQNGQTETNAQPNANDNDNNNSNVKKLDTNVDQAIEKIENKNREQDDKNKKAIETKSNENNESEGQKASHEAESSKGKEDILIEKISKDFAFFNPKNIITGKQLDPKNATVEDVKKYSNYIATIANIYDSDYYVDADSDDLYQLLDDIEEEIPSKFIVAAQKVIQETSEKVKEKLGVTLFDIQFIDANSGAILNDSDSLDVIRRMNRESRKGNPYKFICGMIASLKAVSSLDQSIDRWNSLGVAMDMGSFLSDLEIFVNYLCSNSTANMNNATDSDKRIYNITDESLEILNTMLSEAACKKHYSIYRASALVSSIGDIDSLHKYYITASIDEELLLFYPTRAKLEQDISNKTKMYIAELNKRFNDKSNFDKNKVEQYAKIILGISETKKDTVSFICNKLISGYIDVIDKIRDEKSKIHETMSPFQEYTRKKRTDFIQELTKNNANNEENQYEKFKRISPWGQQCIDYRKVEEHLESIDPKFKENKECEMKYNRALSEIETRLQKLDIVDFTMFVSPIIILNALNENNKLFEKLKLKDRGFDIIPLGEEIESSLECIYNLFPDDFDRINITEKTIEDIIKKYKEYKTNNEHIASNTLLSMLPILKILDNADISENYFKMLRFTFESHIYG